MLCFLPKKRFKEWNNFFVTKWDDSCYKVGQDRCYEVRRKLLQMGRVLQSETEIVTK